MPDNEEVPKPNSSPQPTTTHKLLVVIIVLMVVIPLLFVAGCYALARHMLT